MDQLKRSVIEALGGDRFLSRIGIVGPGRVGRAIGRLVADSADHTVVGLVGRTDVDGAAAFIGEGRSMQLSELVGATPDVLMVTVQDNVLRGVVAELAGMDLSGIEVIHCSGALSLDVLAPCRSAGACVGAIHPVCSFSTPERGIETFQGTPCVVEGDDTPTSEILFNAIGGTPVRMPSGGDKARYHAAIAIACNYLYTLHGAANELLQEVGFTSDVSDQLLKPIMNNTLENSFELGPKLALTGPVVRGDVDVVKAHIEALSSSTADLYRALGMATMALAGDRVPTEALQRLERLFRG